VRDLRAVCALLLSKMKDDDQDEQPQALPLITVGQSFLCKDAILTENKQSRRKVHRATLLSAMENRKIILTINIKKVIEKQPVLELLHTCRYYRKLFSTFILKTRQRNFSTKRVFGL
jgi:hypothetical protein